MAGTQKQQAVFTQEQFEAMLAQMQAQQNALIEKMGNQNLEAIREMKRKPDWEQEKEDKQRARELENRIQRVKEGIVEQRTKAQVQLNCEIFGHKKHNLGVAAPQHAFSGQTNSDGLFRPVCMRCFKQFPPIKATDEQMRSGIKLQDLKVLTTEILYEWHKRTVPDCKDCAHGGCVNRMERELKNRVLDPAPTVLPTGKVQAASVA